MNVYQVITNEIIKKLEEGTIPWVRPYNGVFLPPTNFKSNKRYRGINTMLLSMAGKRSPYWLTYKQAESLGGQIIKGSKGHKIIFAKMLIVTDDEGKTSERPVYRYSTVFNLTDIDNIECPYGSEEIVNENFEYIENCEQAIEQMKEANKIPPIKYHDNSIAFYRPGTDEIYTCAPNEYIEQEAYYSTLFHEIIHSTGHHSRLGRDMTGSPKSKAYAKEELIAEIGSCFLCGITGIKTKTIDNTAAYIKSWLGLLKDDTTLVIQASSKAQAAVDYLGVEVNVELETEESHVTTMKQHKNLKSVW